MAEDDDLGKGTSILIIDDDRKLSDCENHLGRTEGSKTLTSSVELIAVVFVLSSGTEVVYSPAVAMSFIQESSNDTSIVAPHGSHTGSRESHDNQTI